MGIRGEVFSSKAHTAKRVYFFNVKENRNGDLFLNMVESKKAEEGQNFERHSMIIFEEDLDVFLESLNKAVDYIRRVQGYDEESTFEEVEENTKEKVESFDEEVQEDALEAVDSAKEE